MRNQLLTIRTIAATALCLASAFTHAEISKCVDQQGDVVYSDTACSDAATTMRMESDPLRQTEWAAPKPVSRMVLDNTPLKQTAWATMPIQQRHRSTDTVTVSQARQALAEMDSVGTSMRAMKLASNR